MISYDEALNCIHAALAAARPTTIPTATALGTVTSQAVISQLDVPDFDNAAMDGIAVRAADLQPGSGQSAPQLPISATVAAGEAPGLKLAPGSAVEIMTGAPIPAGADMVIPVERISITGAGDTRRATVQTTTQAGANVRRAGEDFKRGDQLLVPGTTISPEAIMNLAAAGIDSLAVYPKPSVAIITTGRELARSGSPRGSGLIRDSNGPYLAKALSQAGARVTHDGGAGDELADIVAAAGAAMQQAQIIVTTGGVSAGRFDYVPAAVNELGGDILFHKVSIRPGKPILFARLPDDRWWFGLPGNPVAVAVGLRFFIIPALRALQGLPPEKLLAATTVATIGKRAGLRFFGKAHAALTDSGQLEVAMLPGQESFRIRPLLRANCWAVVEEGLEQVPAGSIIQVAPMQPTDFLQPGPA